MSVAIIVPFRTSCPHRTAVWAWLRTRWGARFPTWEILETADDPGPWRKGAAVTGALPRTSAEVLVVADADVWCDGILSAVAAVRSGAAWALPHREVYRLTEAATAQVLAGANPRELARSSAANLVEEPYAGKIGGGMLVLSRATLLAVPLDPRFEGWGAEDEAWGYALRTLVGEPVRFKQPLVHLWHPPAERRSRYRGSPENEALKHRYVKAHLQPAEMRALVAEIAAN